eukprot:TRINITY_DN2369_c0_g1_i1.p1 TRINITY_DN2369_c0_g1~~TRINITY_DN2369_c0_g1_i1.p1  ORF type:complete len:450 (-),score=93.91 TRINITY_DN2369_c0_g1_i1:116-1405(-)
MSGIFELKGDTCPQGCPACVLLVQLEETSDRTYTMEVQVLVNNADAKMYIMETFSDLLEDDSQIRHASFFMEKNGDVITFEPLGRIAGVDLCDTSLTYNDRTFTVDWGQRTSLHLPPYEAIHAATGYKILFDWIKSHDVFLFSDEEHYNDCDFDDATELSLISPYNFELTDEYDGETLYFGCSIESHCSYGKQKVTVHVTGIVEQTNTVSTIDWRMSGSSKYEREYIYEGDEVQFTWNTDHDVTLFADSDHYDLCDFDDALELAGSDMSDYTFLAGPNDVGETFYLGCAFSNGIHCKFGNQKIIITVLEDDELPPVVGTPVGEEVINPPTNSGEAVAISWRLQMSTNEYDAHVGDTLRFVMSGNLNVFLFEDEGHFNDCNFSGAPQVTGDTIEFLVLESHLDETLYFGSSVGELCEANGLKVSVNVVDI